MKSTLRGHDRQRTYNVTLRCVRATTVAVEKKYVLHILSVFVALGVQHAMRMRHNVICGLSRSTNFFTLSYKRQDLRKQGTEYKMCALIFSTTLF